MNRVKLMRYGSGSLLLFFTFILQSTILRSIEIRGIVPNLMIIVIISFGLLRGKIDGAIAGAVLGLLQDIYFGDVIGFFALIYMYIGFATGHLHMNFYKDSMLIPIGVMAAADVLVNLLVFFFTFLFRGQLHFHLYLGQIIIPELIYTVFVGFLLYQGLYMINSSIEEVEWSKEYEE